MSAAFGKKGRSQHSERMGFMLKSGCRKAALTSTPSKMCGLFLEHTWKRMLQLARRAELNLCVVYMVQSAM
jgi:hypothetical protein